jgi:hypothetical protein
MVLAMRMKLSLARVGRLARNKKSNAMPQYTARFIIILLSSWPHIVLEYVKTGTESQDKQAPKRPLITQGARERIIALWRLLSNREALPFPAEPVGRSPWEGIR